MQNYNNYAILNRRYDSIKKNDTTNDIDIDIENKHNNEKYNIINNFQKYIGLNYLKNGKFHIFLEKKINTIFIDIKYKTTTIFNIKKHNIFELPREINNLISEYLPQTIYLKFKIFYSDDYPFTQGPIWSLLECNDYLTSYNNISKYYKYLVDSHNVLNSSNSWSPAISIEKDILYFITKLNKFENLIYCL